MAEFDTISNTLKKTEYAVRGPIVVRAGQIEADLKKNPGNYPFKNMIYCNIGNPQALKQKPLTFPRQVSALTVAPQLLDDPKVNTLFPQDAVQRARDSVSKMGGTGAYTHSGGYEFVRRRVAEFIEKRDNAGARRNLGACPWDSVWLTNGASPGVQFSLQLLINGPQDGIMIPIPQYPLYTATIALLNGTVVPYYLDESKGWCMTMDELERSYNEATAKGIKVRSLAIINPGNPTGQVLRKGAMEDAVRFCHKKKLLLMTDEVYQENVYDPNLKFHSFREVLLSMGAPYATELQLISFHTTSKGIIGECGRRGGYMQIMNLPPKVMEQFTKLPSINLCPNVTGQIMCDLMVHPPQPGDASYASHKAEYDAIFQSLQRRALTLVKHLNEIPGIHSNPIEGAMYAYPTLKLPKKFVEEAKRLKKPADFVWCMGLLEKAGVVVIPGSGFGQVPGTYHFRITILPPEDQMAAVTERVAKYQKAIIAKYGPIDGETSKL